MDTFGRWRVIDPLEYFRRMRDERNAMSRLEDILGSETRNAVAKHDLIEIVRTDRERKPLKDETLAELAKPLREVSACSCRSERARRMEKEIQTGGPRKLAEFGIELLDLRFKRINYNPSVVEKIYERMISERQQIASSSARKAKARPHASSGRRSGNSTQIESEAYKEVQKIRGTADAKATGNLRPGYNQTPEAAELYEFVKSMETFKNVIGPDARWSFRPTAICSGYLKARGHRPPAGPGPLPFANPRSDHHRRPPRTGKVGLPRTHEANAAVGCDKLADSR